MTLRYLSLFSGIEAAGIWHELGWECVGLAEIEPFPCKVLAHHFPSVPNLGSVLDITEAQVRALGHIDVIVFGAPCQDLSIAGKRKGFTNADGSSTRSGLFFTALQIAEWSGARFSILENVPGLYSSNRGADFAAVVGEMAGARFDVPKKGWPNTGVALGQRGLVEWVTLDAQFIRTPRFPRAVPQRRRRVFVVRDSGDWASRPPLFLEPESLCGNPPPSRKTREAVAASPARSVAGCCRSDSDHNPRSIPDHIARCTTHSDDGFCLSSLRGDGESNMVSAMRMVRSSEQHTFACGGIGNYLSGDDTSPLMRTGADLGPGCEAIIMSNGQPNAEISVGFAPTLNCNHEQPIAFALAGNTIGRKPENGGNGTGYDETGSSYTLTKTDVHAVPFSAGNSSAARGVGYSEEHTPPLRAGVSGTNMTPTIAVSRSDIYEISCDCGWVFVGALSEPCPSCEKIQGGSTNDVHAVAFQQNTRDEVRYMNGDGRPLPAIAFHIDAQPDEMNFSEHTAATSSKSQHAGVCQTMQVRRLTPTECARLQAFPDDWLSQVPGVSDTAQYKALGNSMARNVMDCIGMRIDTIVTNL